MANDYTTTDRSIPAATTFSYNLPEIVAFFTAADATVAGDLTTGGELAALAEMNRGDNFGDWIERLNAAYTTTASDGSYTSWTNIPRGATFESQISKINGLMTGVRAVLWP